MTSSVTLDAGAAWVTARRVLTAAELDEVLRWYDAAAARWQMLQDALPGDFTSRPPDAALAVRLTSIREQMR